MILRPHILSILLLLLTSCMQLVAQNVDSTSIKQDSSKLQPILIDVVPVVVDDSFENVGGVIPDTVITIQDSAQSEAHYKYMFEERVSTVVDKVFRPDSQLKADSIIKVFDDSPSFGIYKNNYILIGSDLLKHPNSDNSDAKFQISVMQRLTNSVLPFKTYLFLTYTQLAFWDVFKESFPFRDINFNPTIGLGRPLVKDNRYLGDISLQFEHESNGKDGDDSRSWNKISFSGLFLINRHWSLFSKLWIPFVDGENNPDIVQYKGYGTFALNYRQRERYNMGVILTPRSGGFGNMNIAVEASYRLFKSENQYLFFQFYNGFGEGQLDYKEFHQRFRIGFVISPSFRSLY